MKKIIIASTNPVKINATLNGFKTVFPDEEFIIEGVSVPSGVPNQPMTEEETLTGATNRASGAKETLPDADFWVGIEGGVQEHTDSLHTCAWIVVIGKDKVGKGRSASFFLPRKVSELIKEGKELGEADDIVFGKTNSKQQNGAVGILTGDIITRTSLYTPAVILALIPFKNKDLYD